MYYKIKNKSMKLQGKYNIEIIVNDNFNENQVIKVTTTSTKEIEENLRLLDKMIAEYDEENNKQCYQCNEYFHIDDMSIPEGLDDVLICQDCLQKILSGEIILKNIESCG